MSETRQLKTAPATSVIVREARGVDAAALAELYRSLVQDPRINVRPERLEAVAADPHNYLPSAVRRQSSLSCLCRKASAMRTMPPANLAAPAATA